mmetsp:Transcript_374/g.786  ORF Transcript_374/g.786 Transcript_374/m.786 type:complete len:257 (+) Transcript_374:270-1040(+)
MFDALFATNKYSCDLCERSHCFTIIVSDKSLEKGHRSLNSLFRKESKDTNLGQSAVVDLLNKSTGLLLGRFVFGEAKGIEKVEWHRVGDHASIRKFGVCSRNTTAHVMGASGLGVPFEETDEKDDLPLSGGGEGIPLFWWGSGGGGEGSSVEGNWPGEVDSVRLDDVTYERGHGDTSVFDFRLTEECNGLIVGVSPDGGGGELKRIVELQHGVGFLGDRLKIIKGGIGCNRCFCRGCWGKGRSRTDQEGNQRELHG